MRLPRSCQHDRFVARNSKPLVRLTTIWRTFRFVLFFGASKDEEIPNAVNLEVVNNEAVRVFGKESAGQYLELVDLNTGKNGWASSLWEVAESVDKTC